MKTKILLVVAMLLLASCSQKEYEQLRMPVVFISSVANNDVEVDVRSEQTKANPTSGLFAETVCDSVRIQIHYNGATKRNGKTYRSLTKTAWQASEGTTNWVANDNIGIYVRRTTGGADPNVDLNNIKYNTQSNSQTGTFTPVSTTIYYPELTTKTVSFFAYYPYDNIAGTEPSLIKFVDQADEADYTSISYDILTDQTTTKFAASDLMVATKQTGKSKSNLAGQFTFNPKLSLFSLTLNCTSPFSGKSLTRIELTGTKVTSKGTVNLDSGNITPETTTTFIPYSTRSRILNSGSALNYNFIINPCSISANGDMNLVLTINAKVYTIPIIPPSPPFSFVGGSQHKITVNLTTV